MDYAELLRVFESRRTGYDYKRLSPNVKLVMNNDKSLSVQLYSTSIVTRFPNDDMEIRTGGWHTSTTFKKIGDYAGVYIGTSDSRLETWNYDSALNIRGWKMSQRVPSPVDPEKFIMVSTPFYEGIRLNRGLEVVSEKLPIRLRIQDKEIAKKAKALMRPLFEMKRVAKQLEDVNLGFNPSLLDTQKGLVELSSKLMALSSIEYAEVKDLSKWDIDFIRNTIRSTLGDPTYLVELEQIDDGKYRWNRVE